MNRRYLTGADTVSFLLGGEGSGHRASWQILASRFFRNLWTLQQRYHVMDTDFWRMQVGKVPGVHIIYVFYIVFFQPFCWGSHRVPRWLYLSEFDRRRRSCMAWKLRVGRKADQKMVVVVRFSFWSNDKKVCFQSDILIWKCKRVDNDISSFCHIPIEKISQFIRSEAPNHIDLQHWWCGFAFKRAYRIWGTVVSM